MKLSQLKQRQFQTYTMRLSPMYPITPALLIRTQ